MTTHGYAPVNGLQIIAFEQQGHGRTAAYWQVSPHPEQLHTFFDKSVKRMLEFKGWRAEAIQSIQVPTLVMVGDADGIGRASSRYP